MVATVNSTGTSTGVVITPDSSGVLALQTAGTTAITIDASQNVGINTTSQVNSGKISLAYAGNANQGFAFNDTSSNATAQVLRFSSGGTLVGYIQTSTSATTYVTSSDYRLKEDIQPMTGAMSKIAQLKPCTYKWKVDGSNGQGFIAHELQAVIPDCVTGAKDAVDEHGNPDYQGIDVSFLVATLTAALQETKALIDTQAETINALTARIVAIEGK